MAVEQNLTVQKLGLRQLLEKFSGIFDIYWEI